VGGGLPGKYSESTSEGQPAVLVRLVTIVEKVEEGDLQRAGQLLQRFYRRDRVSIFDPRNVAPKILATQ
jgi:hypothetical protein